MRRLGIFAICVVVIFSAVGCAVRDPAVGTGRDAADGDSDYSDSHAFRYYAGPGADEVELPRPAKSPTTGSSSQK